MKYSDWLELNKSERAKEFLEMHKQEFDFYCREVFWEDEGGEK